MFRVARDYAGGASLTGPRWMREFSSSAHSFGSGRDHFGIRSVADPHPGGRSGILATLTKCFTTPEADGCVVLPPARDRSGEGQLSNLAAERCHYRREDAESSTASSTATAAGSVRTRAWANP